MCIFRKTEKQRQRKRDRDKERGYEVGSIDRGILEE